MFNPGKRTKPKLSAYDYAVMMLSRGDYSKAALAAKMARKYAAAETGEALSRLAEQGYLDERRMVDAAWRSLYGAGKLPVRLIKHKLREKGFPAEFIAACAEDLDYGAIREHDLKAAQKLAAQKFGNPDDGRGGYGGDDADGCGDGGFHKRREWEKIAAFLYRHGFDYDICRTVAGSFIDGDVD